MMKRCFTLFVLLLLLTSCQQETETNPSASAGKATGTPALSTRAATAVPAASTPDEDEDGTGDATGGSTRPAAPATPTGQPTNSPTSTPGTSVTNPAGPGALVDISMSSQVGVLLDELPEAMRERATETLLEADEDFWVQRAIRQIKLTKLNLNFRNYDDPTKGQLPLPPVELWDVELDPAGPSRRTVGNHDVVAVDYVFRSTLLTDPDSLAESEPALAESGGVWEEGFVFPVDPDLLLQRTGNACVNEAGFPANSYDSENVWHFYDHACTADSIGIAGCHRVVVPQFSCQEALDFFVGPVQTAVRFERLEWDDELADAVRIGNIEVKDAPDLRVVTEDLRTHRIIYRYIGQDNCALVEGAVPAPGWRRLLQFDATVHNIGGAPLHVGQVREDPLHNVFQYSPCHNHFHYLYYGEFFLDGVPDIIGRKQAFCVQSTSRYSNNEASPLTHDYSCRFQGIQTGWVDEYVAGLDTQWIDITELEVPDDGLEVQLGFSSNEDRFLCEGQPRLDENDEQVWEPTEYTTMAGLPVDRPVCDFIDEWDNNNVGLQEVTVQQTGSFVTAPCQNGEIGPRRNCDFVEIPFDEEANMCAVDRDVTRHFRVRDAEAPVVLRVCEYSDALGIGVACTFEDSVANVIIGDIATEVTFACPRIRDAEEFSGGYSFYVAPVWPEDELQDLVE